MKKFTIDRRTWLRGEGADSSFLLRPEDGKMCCLGQICLQMGATPEQIQSLRTPFSESEVAKMYERDIPSYHFTSRAMPVNDDENISDIEREQELTRMFLDQGIELVFEN